MREYWYLVLLLILIAIEAIPFLKTCKEYGLKHVIREYVRMITIAGIALFIVGSVICLIKIEQSQERMKLTLDECNELIRLANERR